MSSLAYAGRGSRATVFARIGSLRDSAAVVVDSLLFTPIQVKPTDRLPREFRLEQNYPNPFNPTTTIRFSLPHSSHVRLTVYDILGREIAHVLDDLRLAGVHEATWQGKNAQGKPVASGVYQYRIQAREFVQSKQFLLLR